jgi:hypothetical protein
MFRRISLLCAVLAGCGGPAQRTEGLNVQVLTSPLSSEDPFSGVAVLDFVLSVPAQTQPFERQASYTAGQPVDLTATAPIVDGARLTIELLGIQGGVLSVGRTASLKAQPGGNTTAPMFVGHANQFSSAPSSPSVARSGSSATVLPNGRVVIAGGATGDPNTQPSTVVGTVELYDPTTGEFTSLGAGQPRALHGAVALSDGRVALIGGIGTDGKARNDVDLVDATAGSITAGPSLPAGRYALASVLLTTGGDAGQVLVVGGWKDATTLATDALLIDAAAGQVTSVATTGMPARASAVATALGNAAGEVLITGGIDASGPRDDAAVYEPSSRTFLTPGAAGGNFRGRMLTRRVGHTATLLTGGAVLILGGSQGSTSVAAPEVFFPEAGNAGAFVTVSSTTMPTPREGHVAVLLDGGAVLIAGGQTVSASGTTALTEVERFDPTPSETDVAAGTALYQGNLAMARYPLPSARVQPAVATLPDGTALLLGGSSGSAGTPVSGALVYVACVTSFKNRCPDP